MRQSTENSVKKRIIGRGRGWCFTPRSFLDLGNDESIRKALSELYKQKVIRRLAQGVYDYPTEHNVLGMIPPNLNDVAKAIAEKMGYKSNQLEPLPQIWPDFPSRYLGGLFF